MLLLLLLPAANAACPAKPALLDADDELTVLEQNLKFISVGAHREERAALLHRYLVDEGRDVDLLLLSEARITRALPSADWCFYTQDGGTDGYAWAPIESGTPPGGLAMGVRHREAGHPRVIAGGGRPFRARPVSLAEGVLGSLVHYVKGWASLVVDDTQIVWSHTQASYKRRPERGAGALGRGRSGQFDDLADDLGHPSRATLITGDLNLLAGFTGRNDADEARVKRARDIDAHTMDAFRTRTGVDLSWFADAGTFVGSVFTKPRAATWDVEAKYDRVGVNPAFLARHPGTHVAPVEIRGDRLRVSDHLGLRITIPFANAAPGPGLGHGA